MRYHADHYGSLDYDAERRRACPPRIPPRAERDPDGAIRKHLSECAGPRTMRDIAQSLRLPVGVVGEHLLEMASLGEARMVRGEGGEAIGWELC